MDPVRGRRGVPLVDGRVVLDARVAAQVRGLGHLVEQVAGLVGVHDLVRGDDRVGRPLPVVDDGLHERIGHADRVVGVLEEDRAVGLAGEAGVVAGLDQRPGLLLLVRLRIDELDDVRMAGIEDDHLGRATGLAARLHDAGEGVVALHEGDGARGGAAAGHLLAGGADGGEVAAGARAELEQHRLGLGQVHDRGHRVLDRVDEAGASTAASASMPTLNQTGELNAIFWWTIRWVSSALKVLRSASVAK